MPGPLVECIPNFSEARRPEVIEAITAAIAAVKDVHILDRHSDLDHNRTVITFVGSPAAVEEAAFAAIATAGQLINLDHHRGEHPRIGATDVVPFVPISGVTMQECVEMARRLGQRVGSELNIPVYLYEEASTRPERKNLENIRHGQYEGLKQEIETNPERQPDFGPCRLGPAGATVIGARQPLIAFNVYLTTDDVSVAQKIARAIRHSSGGLRYVKAMGVMVEGRAQVSMNLTNYRQTPIERVVEMIRREAARYGTAIHHSELVGLIPQEALARAAVWFLQLDEFNTNQILEQKLQEVRAASAARAHIEFLDQLASAKPTPAGGSATAFAGAAAAALVAMVGRVTVSKKQYAAVAKEMGEIIEQAENLRARLTAAVEEDSTAYEELITALRLPKESEEQQAARAQAIELATYSTARVPLMAASAALEVIRLAVQAASSCGPNVIADAGSAIILARAALAGADLNIHTNLKNLAFQPEAQAILNEMRQIELEACSLENKFRTILKERSGITLPQ